MIRFNIRLNDQASRLMAQISSASGNVPVSPCRLFRQSLALVPLNAILDGHESGCPAAAGLYPMAPIRLVDYIPSTILRNQAS
jgi:hypothetical protein